MVLPLSIVCIAVVIAIPAAAARARLHIPGYVGLAFLAFALALLLGWLSGTHSIAGTTTGLLLSIVFFLLIAAAVGCVVALVLLPPSAGCLGQDFWPPPPAHMTPRNYRQPLAIGATVLSLFLCICGLIVTLPPAYRGLGDFRQLYTAGYMVRTGHSAQLHDFAASEKLQIEIVGPAVGALPFNHLAVESLLFAPFSLVPYRTAYVAFFLINIALLAVSFNLLRPYLSSLAEIWTLLPAATFAAFLPVTLALAQGQDSILLLLLFVAAYRAADQEHEIAAGALVGLTLFKFQYGLPIALLFLVWRRWRFLAGFAATAAAMVTISLALTGIDGFVAYLRSLTEMSARFTATYGALYGIHPNLMPNIRGLVQAHHARSIPIHISSSPQRSRLSF